MIIKSLLLRIICLYLLFVLTTLAARGKSKSYIYRQINSTNYIGVSIGGNTLNQYTWHQAQAYCQSKFGTNLATILNVEDQEEIVSIVSSSQWDDQVENLWTGWSGIQKARSKIYSWTPCTNCSDMYECSASDEVMAKWHGLRAMNFIGSECGIIMIKNGLRSVMGKWSIQRCNKQHDFICNKNGAKYDPMPFLCGSAEPTSLSVI